MARIRKDCGRNKAFCSRFVPLVKIQHGFIRPYVAADEKEGFYDPRHIEIYRLSTGIYEGI